MESEEEIILLHDIINDRDRQYYRDLVRAFGQGELASQDARWTNGSPGMIVEYYNDFAVRICDIADAVLAEVKKREKKNE